MYNAENCIYKMKFSENISQLKSNIRMNTIILQNGNVECRQIR